MSRSDSTTLLRLAWGVSAVNVLAIVLSLWALVESYRFGGLVALVVSGAYFLLFALVLPGSRSDLPGILRAVFFPLIPLLLYWAYRSGGSAYTICVLIFISFGLVLWLVYKKAEPF